MGRKDTVHTAIHKTAADEVLRIQREAFDKFGIEINKLEASYFEGVRSSIAHMSKLEFIDYLRRLRSGI
jgi:hypothetical protein